MEHKYITCECSSMEHTIRFSYFKDEPDLLYVEFHLNQTDRWYKRIWKAVKYIFGYRSKYGEFGEAIWEPNSVKDFILFGQEFLNNKDIK